VPKDSMPLYYVSAAVAITGAVGYHILARKVPATMDPIVSILGTYVGVVAAGLILLPLMGKGQVMTSVKQLGWVQVGMAICVALMGWGFMLMYRSGWALSVGNVVTGVVINLALVGAGVCFLREDLNKVNILGILLSIAGVAMIGYREKPLDVAGRAASVAEVARSMASMDPRGVVEPYPTD